MNAKSVATLGLALALSLVWPAPQPAAAARHPEYILTALPWEADQQAVTARLEQRKWQLTPGKPGPWSGFFLLIAFACCPLAPADTSDQVMTLAASSYSHCQIMEASEGKDRRLSMIFSQVTGKILCYEFRDKDTGSLAVYLINQVPDHKTAQCRGGDKGPLGTMPYCQDDGLIVSWPDRSNRVLAVFTANIAAHLKAIGRKPIKLPPPPC
jgi:hypothetical protein